MKKYKIRVRFLPENICCGFIVSGLNVWGALDRCAKVLIDWTFTDYEIISIGEL